jgi:TnpA family transposase
LRSDLERFILLDDADQLLVDRRRGGHNRLGFALQLTTVRYLGAFLEDPLDVPWAVVEYLAEQVGVLDPSIVKSYTRRRTTRFEHAWEIQGAYGFRSIEDPEAGREFEEFLRDRAWVHAEARRHCLIRQSGGC